jgi:hypothetical protein
MFPGIVYLNKTMCSQSNERIFYKGKWQSMETRPLEQCPEYKLVKSQFRAETSMNWRGYTGKWAIKKDRLFMVGLKGNIWAWKVGYKPVDMGFLFPGQEKVAATWYSGKLVLPQGESLLCGFYNLYPEEIVLSVEQGKVTGAVRLDNAEKNRELIRRSMLDFCDFAVDEVQEQ